MACVRWWAGLALLVVACASDNPLFDPRRAEDDGFVMSDDAATTDATDDGDDRADTQGAGALCSEPVERVAFVVARDGEPVKRCPGITMGECQLAYENGEFVLSSCCLEDACEGETLYTIHLEPTSMDMNLFYDGVRPVHRNVSIAYEHADGCEPMWIEILDRSAQLPLPDIPPLLYLASRVPRPGGEVGLTAESMGPIETPYCACAEMAQCCPPEVGHHQVEIDHPLLLQGSVVSAVEPQAFVEWYGVTFEINLVRGWQPPACDVAPEYQFNVRLRP